MVDVHTSGMGNVASLHRNEWAVLHNPAGLPWCESSFGLLSYSDRYQLKELAKKNLGAGIYFHDKSVGISAGTTGDARLRHSSLTASYSQRFGKQFSLGLKLNYESMRFAELYGRKDIFYGSFGFLTKLGKQSYLSFLIENPGRQVFDERYQQLVESSASIGVSQNFSPVFSLLAEFRQSSSDGSNFRMAAEYQFHQKFTARCGYELVPGRSAFGLTFLLGRTSLDLSFSYEGKVGISSGTGLLYHSKIKP